MNLDKHIKWFASIIQQHCCAYGRNRFDIYSLFSPLLRFAESAQSNEFFQDLEVIEQRLLLVRPIEGRRRVEQGNDHHIAEASLNRDQVAM